MTTRRDSRLGRWAAPIAGIIACLILWQSAVRLGRIPAYLLPTPEAVAVALWRGLIGGEYWPHIAFTLASTSIGYVCGCATAFVLGVVIAESPGLERAIHPLIVGFQAVPKVALAPLIIAWFGYELLSKVVMVTLICFFPLFINTVAGLRSANPQLLELMRSLTASRTLVFYRVRLPSAAGHIFAALQVSVILSLIGALVSEFVASTRGLGYLIKAASVNLDTAEVFAVAVALAIIGIGGTSIVRVLERRIVFWSDHSPRTLP